MNSPWRIVGISDLAVRPATARHEKPKVGAFISAKIGEIVKRKPDFVGAALRQAQDRL